MSHPTSSRSIGTVLAALALCAGLLATWSSPAPAADKRAPVVVLGFDGADARLVQQWMDSGDLPNLAALRSEGVFSPLRSTNPPQTPVSWASFSTGLSPGGHGVFDFLKRSPNDYMPDFAMNSPIEDRVLFGDRNPPVLGAIGALILGLLALGVLKLVRMKRGPAGVLAVVVVLAAFPLLYVGVLKYIPRHRPDAVSLRHGRTFWQLAGDAGLRTVVLHVPGTFPVAPARHGRLLSGLGVPDMRGTFGTYTYYTTSSAPTRTGGGDTEMGGKVMILDRGLDDYQTIIYGPQNRLFDKPPEITLPLAIHVDRDRGQVVLSANDQTATLSPGQWSDWFLLDFSFNPLFKAHGIARFYLIEAAPDLKLYLSSINWNPMKPPLPISVPGAFAADLARRVGLYKTVGWVEDTWALNEEVIEEHAYDEDVERTVSTDEEIMKQLLAKGDFDLYVQVYTFTDRAAHMYWRATDPLSPRYTPQVAQDFGDAIKLSYERMDGIIGEARKLLPPNATLIVCSDHGFSTWRRSINYNTWLVQNGYMTLHAGIEGMHTLEDLFGRGEFWPNVDWQNTRAYALGLGSIYINLAGREAQGIVRPGAEYDALCAEIQSKLEAFVDSTTGEHPVLRVYRRDEMYPHYDPNLVPDLRAANNLGYRVSWQTSLGGIPSGFFSDNTRKWSGDHCSLDPSVVPGILFSNRRFDAAGAWIGDLFPTILTLLDLPVPTGIDAHTLKLTEGTVSRASP